MYELDVTEIGFVSGAGPASDLGGGILGAAALGLGILALPELTLLGLVGAGVFAAAGGFGAGMMIGEGLGEINMF